MISNPVWYKERILGNIRLGSLVAIVLVKTVLYNVTHQKDLYLNNNCLAIISNMAPYYEHMHTCAAQRLVFLMHVLTNKYKRLQKRNVSRLCVSKLTLYTKASEEEMEIYLKFLQMCIESINACLTYAMKRNLRLVYELLYKRSVVGSLQRLGIAPQLVNNMEIVIQYFAQQLRMAEENQTSTTNDAANLNQIDTLDTPIFNDQAEDQFFSRKRNITLDEDADIELSEYVDNEHNHKNWTVEEVMEILERGAKLWGTTSKERKLVIFEHLPFRYTEDANAEA